MPHFAFEMISKAYTRRKTFYNGFSLSTASRNHTSVFTQKISLRASGGALADWKQVTSLTSFSHAFSGSLLAGQGLRNRRRPLGAWINQNGAVHNVQAVRDGES